MGYQSIRFGIENRVARITLARPPLNVINIPMMREMADALRECREQREVVAIVFDAAEETRAFSAGVAVEDHEEKVVYQMLENFHSIFRLLGQISKPTLALVNGPALGGGCELVAGCDIVLATERARFGQPEIKLGGFPPVASVRLPRIIGEKRALEMILTGELIDEQEAWRIGLVNHVVPAAELEAKAQEILGRLRELSASVLQVTRQAVELGRGSAFIKALDEAQNFYLEELLRVNDAREGVRAFTEKRKPLWRNR
jgi:cyclohexa-1,5-dienecarbonyl-CoA hydratase